MILLMYMYICISLFYSGQFPHLVSKINARASDSGKMAVARDAELAL